MEQCFGAENVNVDGEEEFESCTAKDVFGGDAAPILKALPGCNPIQSGPADATKVSGPDCAATAVPVLGGTKTSASLEGSQTISSSAVTSSSQTIASSSAATSLSQTTASSSAATSVQTSASTQSTSEAESYPTGVVNDETSALPSLALSIPNKQLDAMPTSGYDAVKPTPSVADTPKDAAKPSSASVDGVASLSLTPTAAPAGQTDSLVGDHGEQCKAPVYVTVTPTVYVTLGANAISTSCSGNIMSTTVTQMATVTVQAHGGVNYGKF